MNCNSGKYRKGPEKCGGEKGGHVEKIFWRVWEQIGKAIFRTWDLFLLGGELLKENQSWRSIRRPKPSLKGSKNLMEWHRDTFRGPSEGKLDE